MPEKNPKVRYRQLLLLYSLAIIIPGVILAILAFRGIQGNTAAEEKLRDERLARKAGMFFSALENSMVRYSRVFSPAQFEWTNELLELKEGSRAQELINENVIIGVAGWESDSVVKLLNQTALFVPEDYWVQKARHPELLQNLINCQALEFDDKDLIRAQLWYARISNLTDDPFIKLEALIGEARSHRKLQQYGDCRNVYRRIFEEVKYPEIRRRSIPKARITMGKIIEAWFQNLTLHSTRKSYDLLALEVLVFLGLPQSSLLESYYEDCFNDTRALYDEQVADSGVPESYKQAIDSLFTIRQTHWLQNRVVGKLMDQIEKVLTNKESSRKDSRTNYLPYLEDTLAALIKFEHHANHHMAIVVNTRDLIARTTKMLDESSGFKNKISWCILDEENQVLHSHPDFNDRQPSYQVSPTKLGVWTLQLQEAKKGWLNVVSDAGQLFFLLGFVFIVLVMLIGLFFTIRGLRNEYRLALLKSDFISTVSHEFKSPLTSIRQMSEMLARDRITKEERKKEYYSSMLVQSERLSHLVDNILDFSRMEDGRKKYSFNSCDLASALTEIVEILKLRYKDSEFNINLDIEKDLPELSVDCDGIQQVFYNLIDNAIKYSGDQKQIDVKLQRIGQEIVFSVKDYGLGISKKDRKKIFARFYRSELASTIGITGSGIGLSIVAQIVRAHNGRVELDSELRYGSTFKVILPMNNNNRT